MGEDQDHWHWQEGVWSSQAWYRDEDFTVTLVAENLDSGLDRLQRAIKKIEALVVTGVEAVIAARRSQLNWRDGPALEDWDVIELRLEADGSLWLSLHEYETDEYALWLVCFAADDATPRALRKAAWQPDNRAFSQRGDALPQ